MKWKLTQAASGEPDIGEWGEKEGEELTLGYSLMRALAESDETLVEVAPGVWRQSWLRDGDVGSSGPGAAPTTLADGTQAASRPEQPEQG